MNTRNQLLSDLSISIKRLRTFSCPEFNGIYSNQYFQNILKNTINNYKNTYSVIFGDFNKLGIINDVYGHKFGDKALKYSLALIKQALPSNAMIIRAGGDEFYIIIPNCTKNNADIYCNKIYNNLNRNRTLVGGLSIDLASADSTSGTIDELIDMTDMEVTNIKSTKKDCNSPADMISDDFLPLSKPSSISENEDKSWNELNTQINECTYNFLQNFRPSKTLNFDKEQISDASNFITANFAYLLGKKLNINLSSDQVNQYLSDMNFKPLQKQESTNNISKPKTLNANTSELIHTLVSKGKNININSLSDKNIEKLISTVNDLVESLIRDKTNLLSKQYFRKFLAKKLCNPNQHLSASYVSTCGIKLSNLAFDHSFTDYRLDKTNTLFLNTVKENLDYNNKSFDTSIDDIHLISQGAGNYLFLYPKEKSVEITSKIKSIVSKINHSCDITDPNSTFKMSYYCINKNQTIFQNTANELIAFTRGLKEETNYEKNPIKKQLFKSVDAFVAFKRLADNCINYYFKNIPNSYKDMDKIHIFIKNIHTSFLNQEVLHNNTRHNKKTNGIIEPDDDFTI